jgi:benzodiazapine receptor
MKTKNIAQIVLAIIICELVGMIGALFTTPAISTWYVGIIKPTFSPPNWIFAPVWTILFALMGIAAYLIYKKGTDKKEIRIALFIFDIQLLLNVLWSVLFFGMHNPGYAFIEIIFLWLAILLTIISFFKISKTAAYLLIPYILWVSFASFLNYSIWQLNSQTINPVACTMEAKLCPDGSAVGRTGPKCEFAPCP